MQNHKLPFYVKRSFGDKINASFAFVKENWKVLLKYTTYLLLPVCMVQAVNMNVFMKSYVDIAMNFGPSTFDADIFSPAVLINYGIVVLLSIVGGLLMTALVFAVIQLYNKGEHQGGITFAMLKSLLIRNILRLFVATLLFILAIVVFSLVVGVLITVSPFTLIVTIPAIIAVIIALCMLYPVYVFEDAGAGVSFAKAWRLGFATWGGLFAILIVMSLIGGILQGVLMMPWYVLAVIKPMLSKTLGNPMPDPTMFNSFITYILGVIAIFGTYLSMVFTCVGLSYHYSHAREKIEKVTVESEISNFENL